MRRIVVLIVAMVMVGSMAVAGELAGVKMPDEVTVSGTTLHLNGMGVRKKLWIKVYIAGLYLEHKTTNADDAISAQEIKRVVMHFRTNKAKKKKMDSAWDEGFEANSPGQVKALHERIQTFKGYFGNMRVDDVVEMTMVPGEGTHVTLNGTEKGLIPGDDFAQGLLKVWLGSEPPSEDLKTGLLGK